MGLILAMIRCGAEPVPHGGAKTRMKLRPVTAKVQPIPVDRDRVPVIARILGVRVDFDTTEHLEQTYDKDEWEATLEFEHDRLVCITIAT